MPTSFDQLWAEKYLPRWREQQQRELESRDEAFLEIGRILCGERVRLMTARDLFLLNGLENPFIAGGRVEAVHIAQLVWLLHEENEPRHPLRSAFRRGRMLGRIRKRDFNTAVREVEDYVEDMTLDIETGVSRGGGAASERAPLNTCMLAPLLVEVSRGLKSAIDPATGLPLIESPLPRLLQYRKTIAAITAGDRFRDNPPSTVWLVECAEEVNRMNAEEAAAHAKLSGVN